MKSNNKLLIGAAIAGFLVYKNATSSHVEGIYGTESRKTIIKNYLWALGLPEGHLQIEARWSKMSTQAIINEAFFRHIIIVRDNAPIRKILTKKYLWAMGLPEGHKQVEARWKKMTLQQIIDEAKRIDVDLLTINL